MNTTIPPSRWRGAAPGLLLMFAAPMCAEVLPGATRLSSLFVLPIEILVWGGGALMIREIVRRRRLGWSALLLLALALAVAEECLIQQTSLAPIVIKLKGAEYARAFGVNYVYLLWALAYEAVLVVLVPVALVELVFPGRAREPWMNRRAWIAVPILFVLGSFLAWFSWTQVARVKVFHLPAFTPPIGAVLAAIGAILALVFLALRGRSGGARQLARTRNAGEASPISDFRNGGQRPAPGVVDRSAGRPTPTPLVSGFVGALGAILWYGLVLLAFGIAPAFPPTVAVAAGGGLCGVLLLMLGRWTMQPDWSARHTYALVSGTILGAMAAGFVGFIGSSRADLWFKIAVDFIALLLLARLGQRLQSVRYGRVSEPS